MADQVPIRAVIGTRRWTWEVVEDPEPDPVVDAWLDYMSELGKIADTYAFYIGPARSRYQRRSTDNEP